MTAAHDSDIPTVPLPYIRKSAAEMSSAAQAFLATMRTRRSVRHFSTEPIAMDVVAACVEAAAQAPSGANRQPWTFCVVTDPALKAKIRVAAEQEETAFYGKRAPQAWLDALQPLGTDANKPFLEDAPALIVLFAQHKTPSGEKAYYPQESVGIAAGFLIAALHHAGLATLTHTPSPMRFLAELLGRPDNERAFLLLPVGFPAEDCKVPAITRKKREDVMLVYAGESEASA